MTIIEIKPGMRFNDNTHSPGYRVVTVVNVSYAKGFVFFEVNGRQVKSRRPERFHREKKSFGYTLIGEL